MAYRMTDLARLLEALGKIHWADRYGFCGHDGAKWPCPTVTAIDTICPIFPPD